MSDEKKYTVDDKIAVVMAGNDDKANIIEYKEFVQKIEDMYRQNVIKPYEKFKIGLVKDTQLGWGLLFLGERNETKEETAQREASEVAKKKQIETAELREYLRLHKKYGKKNDGQSNV